MPTASTRRRTSPRWPDACTARYVALAVALVAASYAGLWATTSIGLPLVLAKPVTDVALYLASYRIQHRVVFRERA